MPVSRTQHSRSGYVLLAVIATSVLVVTVLSTYARISLRRGVEAADAERSLQQRWGAVTLERAVLSRASAIFEARDELPDLPSPPPTTIRDALTINGVTYDLLLGDEDAKLNLNVVFQEGGLEKAQEAASAAIGSQLSEVLRMVPATNPPAARAMEGSGDTTDDEEDVEAPPAVFRSWGEVFDIAQLSQQIGSEVALPSVTIGITCWGSGQLNFRRASDDAIMAVIDGIAQDGAAERMLRRFRANPAASLSVLLITEVKNPIERQRLSERLSENSSNFSLWINASNDTSRSVRQFVVMRRDDDGVTQYEKFTH